MNRKYVECIEKQEFNYNIISSLDDNNLEYFSKYFNKNMPAKSLNIIKVPFISFIIMENNIMKSIVTILEYDEYILINNLYTEKEHRRNGYAKKLLNYVIKYFKKDLYLSVNNENKIAYNLYDKLKFDVISKYNIKRIEL